MEAIKHRITQYWSQRAEQFSELRMKEFASGKHELWIRELERYLPMNRPLKILDVGTGTGFFAFLLASAGHQTTGIDLTEHMIEEARLDSQALGIPADFYVMDAEAPEFPEDSFDAIVTRNLTWTLPHLEQAYRAWHELLKPGGVLVNFDADYCHETRTARLPEQHAHKAISSGLMAEYEQIKEALRNGQCSRPQWDQELLKRVGFRKIDTDMNVWKRVYKEVDEFYNPTPIFSIAAYA